MTTAPFHTSLDTGHTTIRRAAFLPARRRRAVGFVTCLVASVLAAGPTMATTGASAIDDNESSDIADVETGPASSDERLFDFDTATGTIIDTSTGDTVGIYDGAVRQFLSPDGSELIAIVDPANGGVTVVATGELVARVQLSADNSATSSTPSDAVDSDDQDRDGADSDSNGITSTVAYAMIALAGVLVIGLAVAVVRGRRPARGPVEPPVVAPRVDGATLPPPPPPIAATQADDPDITPPAGLPSSDDGPTST